MSPGTLLFDPVQDFNQNKNLSTQDPLYLSRISLIPSRSLYLNLLCTEDKPPRSALGGTLGAFLRQAGVDVCDLVQSERKGFDNLTPADNIYKTCILSLVEQPSFKWPLLHL